jgi:hypothetical protein
MGKTSKIIAMAEIWIIAVFYPIFLIDLDFWLSINISIIFEQI